MTSMRGAIVRLDEVSKSYGAYPVVDRLSLTVNAGEFLTLLGPSGSGKSTILSCIAGFTIPNEGEIRIGEERVTLVPPFKRNVGMVFQNYALFPHLTVTENLAFPLRMRAIDKRTVKDRLDWALSLVKLQDLRSRYPKQLSGGQQQRVALARALIFEAPVLLLDEPLSALDRKLRTEMQMEIRNLHQRLGVTIVFVTHDQEEALTMSDRIAVVNHGRIEQLGRPIELYNHPRNRFVSEFVGESNFLFGDAASSELVTASGLRVPLPVVPTPQGPISISIRPEQILLMEPLPGRLHGRITHVSYIGETSRYIVSTEAGDTLTVKRQNTTKESVFPVGSHVGLHWEAASVVVHRQA
jgi:putative spermidine/putrescine transport system ATP-binding protein